MRVISGSFKGRKLRTGSDRIRPTSDRVRTAIFNILPHDLTGYRVLDLFAGSGALGIEALSRDAESAVFVDQAHEAITILKANLEALDLRDHARLMAKKVSAGLKLLAAEGRRFDLVFLDPPYNGGEADKTMRLLGEFEVLEADALVVAEHRAGQELAAAYGRLAREDRREYGDTAVSFYRAPTAEEDEEGTR